MPNKIKVEFLWDKIGKNTNIFIWEGIQIIDKMSIPEKLSHYIRKKMKKDLIKKYEEE